MLRTFRALLLSLAAVLLTLGSSDRISSAQESAPPVAPPPKVGDVLQDLSDNQSALIVDFPSSQCAWQSHEVVDVNSGETYRTTYLIGGARNGVPERVMLAIVPPGTYAYVDGECRFTSPSYYAVTNPYIGSGHMVYRDNRLNYPYLRYWLRPVTVSGGEVVYSGTITEEQVHYEYGIALTFLERLHGRRTRSTAAFPLYGLEDNSQRVRENLERLSELLSARFVSRVGAVRFERSAARTAADSAFAPAISVVPPNEATATSNRDAGLERAGAALRARAREALTTEFPQGPPRALSNLFADD